MLTKKLLTAACLLFLVVGAQSTSYISLSIPELVVQSDVIVVGTVSDQTDHLCKVVVSKTLLGAVQRGTAVNTVGFSFPKGTEGIFFLESTKDHFNQKGFRALTSIENVRRVTAMRGRPSNYFRDLHEGGSPDFIELLGLLFRDKEAVDGIAKQSAIDHVRHYLTSPERDAVFRAVGALQALGSKDSGSIIPLIHHSDPDVRRRATQFLAWAPDPAAVGPLCNALDAIRGDDPNEFNLGWALVEIGDAAAVPALERATKRRGIGGISRLLGRLGDKASFEILLADVAKGDSMSICAVEGLMALVQRSNKPFAPWMDVRGWSRANGLEHREDWLNWWEQNKSQFKIIRTAKEAYAPK